MHEIDQEAILFYGAIWAIAFLACLCRSVRDITNVNIWNVLAGCGMSGFLAFGFIGFLVDGQRAGDPGIAHSRWYFLGLAALLGIVSKDPDKLAWMVISKALGAIRMMIPKDDNKEE